MKNHLSRHYKVAQDEMIYFQRNKKEVSVLIEAAIIMARVAKFMIAMADIVTEQTLW